MPLLFFGKEYAQFVWTFIHHLIHIYPGLLRKCVKGRNPFSSASEKAAATYRCLWATAYQWSRVEGEKSNQRNRVLQYTGVKAQEGFPCGSAGKESACNVGDLSSIPRLGRSPGEGKGYPFQYSGLENSTDCIVHGVAKSWTRLSAFHFHYLSESMLGKNESIINCWKTVTCTWKELLYSNWLSGNQYS